MLVYDVFFVIHMNFIQFWRKTKNRDNFTVLLIFKISSIIIQHHAHNQVSSQTSYLPNPSRFYLSKFIFIITSRICISGPPPPPLLVTTALLATISTYRLTVGNYWHPSDPIQNLFNKVHSAYLNRNRNGNSALPYITCYFYIYCFHFLFSKYKHIEKILPVLV